MLRAGEQLEAGQHLLSPDNSYQLVMQSDGNLVLYHEGGALWSSGIEGEGAYLAMQSDGNLVIYNHGAAKWSTNTAGFSGAYLQVQDDGNVVIYQEQRPLWDWESGYSGDQLSGDSKLGPGVYLLSENHQYKLVMQGDGNLVLYHEGGALWSSGIEGEGAYLAMQSDGNLVIYNHGAAKWSSNTAGFAGSYLRLQNDDNAVIYQKGHAIWDWGGGYLGDRLLGGGALEPGAYLLSENRQYKLVMQGDGNLVLYHEGKALWSSGTAGDSGANVVMQGDGNLVIYSGGVARWSSGTAGHPNAYVVAQNDSNVVIYEGDTALWDWESGALSSGQPTAAETAAVNWATAHIGSTAWYGLCLSFTFDAYLDGAGVNLEDRTSGVVYNEDTDPEDVWGHTDAGTTGTDTPPYGALVFFDAKPGYNPEEFSHVTIMGANGEMISTPDAVNESDVHYETLAQANGSGSYSTYVGWWLPDG